MYLHFLHFGVILRTTTVFFSPDNVCKNPDNVCKNPDNVCKNPDNFFKNPDNVCKNPDNVFIIFYIELPWVKTQIIPTTLFFHLFYMN